MKVATKTFFFLYLILVSNLLAAQIVNTKDYRQLGFEDAVSKSEYMLAWVASNKGIDRFDIRYVVSSPDGSQSCASGYQNASIDYPYELAGFVNNLPFGTVRLEITGVDSANVSREWIVLFNRPIDSPLVVPQTYRDFSSLGYPAARDKMDGVLSWFQANRDVNGYNVSYTDPGSGAVQQFSVATNTQLNTVLDGLAAGNYEFKVDVVSTDGTVDTRYVALDKLPSDVVAHTANLQLSWQKPTQREDGSALPSGDIAGYEIYMTATDINNQTSDQVVPVNDPSQTNIVLSDMPAGVYHIAISTVDTQGLQSPMSDVVDYTIN